MRTHDLRLLAPAAAAWATAWLATGAPDAGVQPWIPAAACWTVAAAALATALVLARRSAATAATGVALATAAVLVAIAAALAATSASIALGHRDPGVLAAATASRDSVRLVARLDGAPRPGRAAPWDETASLRAPATLLAVGDAGSDATTASTPPIRLDLTMPESDLAPGFGSVVVVVGRVDALPSASRAAYRIRALALIGTSPAPATVAWTHPLRVGLAAASSRLGGDAGALVPGLAIGDISRVSDDLRTAMTTASLTHLTAVSGANCALVTAAAFWLAGLAGLPRAARVVAALASLGGFVALVTPESSVVRAAAMAIVVLVACATARTGGGVPALGVAVIALLALDPWYSRDVGFALSACATAGLVLLAAPLAGVLARWMPRRLAVVISIPLAAQLACQPVLVLLEPVIPVYGVPANLLAAPAAPVATVAGLIGCLVLPLLPSVGYAALQLAWLPASWIAMLARGVEQLPATGVPWPPGPLGALLVLVAGAAAAAVLARTPARQGFLGQGRRVAAVVLCLSIAVPIGAAAGPPLLARATRPGDWDVWQCDIGQGDAVLVRSAGASMLIDAGPDPDALAACLADAGIGRLDLVVLTHWDADHVGGAAALVGRVSAVLHGPLDGDRSARALDPLLRGGATHTEVTAGANGGLGEADWRVVWPQARARPGNDASVVIDLVAPAYRAVFLGDLGRQAQDALLRSTSLGHADLVKVAHHGSADQSPALYRELSASVGLIGVGAANGYGHPTPSLLAMLGECATAPVRSDLVGAAVLQATPEGFSLWTERSGDVAGAP